MVINRFLIHWILLITMIGAFLIYGFGTAVGKLGCEIDPL